MSSTALNESFVSELAIALRLIMYSFHQGNNYYRFTYPAPSRNMGPLGLHRMESGYMREVCVYMYIHTYTHIPIYIHTHIYMHTYMHTYIYMWIDTHIYMFLFKIELFSY